MPVGTHTLRQNTETGEPHRPDLFVCLLGESGTKIGQMDILHVHNVFGFFLLGAKLLFLGETSE